MQILSVEEKTVKSNPFCYLNKFLDFTIQNVSFWFYKIEGIEGVYHTGPFINHFFFFFSWLCCYMSQMNPLIGPVLNQRTLFAIKEYWVRIFRKKSKIFRKSNFNWFFYIFLERLGGSWNHHLSLLPWNKPKVFNALEKNWFIGIFVKVLQISLVFFLWFFFSLICLLY